MPAATALFGCAPGASIAAPSVTRERPAARGPGVETRSVIRSYQLEFRSFDGTRIAYADDGEGRPVILLHGLSADGRMFGPLDALNRVLSAIQSSIGALGVDAKLALPPEGKHGLAARLREIGARVIVPDLRGHGGSDKPHDPAAYAHSAIARDVIALADHLRLADVAVLGYSLGAIAAAKLLALRPTNVSSCVLAGIGKEIIAGEPLELPDGHPAAMLAKPVTMRSYQAFVADVLMEKSVDADDPRAAYLVLPHAMGGDVEAIAAALRGDGAEQIPASALRGAQIPVLVLNGRDDPASLATGRLLEVLPNSRAAVCAGDHLSAPWQPSFQEAVAEFLKEQWAKGDGLA
jgi:pimeloyl-ACP methyl ester carboxylesterase